MDLIKQGNNWLVQFSKVDLMAETPGASDVTMTTDTTGAAAGAPQDTTMSADTMRH